MSAVLCCLSLVLLHRFGLNSVPAGPYGLIFSLCVSSRPSTFLLVRIADSRLWQYHRTVPSLYAFKVCGVPLSSKTFVYILTLQVRTLPLLD